VSQLVECRACGGLKRAEHLCPHCGVGLPRWRRWLSRLLALSAPGVVAACSAAASVQSTACDVASSLPEHCRAAPGVDAYGAPPFPFDSGRDAGDGGADGGPHDGGSDAGD
jgi:hypothetical protein